MMLCCCCVWFLWCGFLQTSSEIDRSKEMVVFEVFSYTRMVLHDCVPEGFDIGWLSTVL